MVLITIVTGAYKPTNITGGPHIARGKKKVTSCLWCSQVHSRSVVPNSDCAQFCQLKSSDLWPCFSSLATRKKQALWVKVYIYIYINDYIYNYIYKMYFREMCISILCIFMPNDWTLRNAIEYEHPPPVMLEPTNVGVTRHTWNYTSLLLGNPSIS